MSTPTPKNTLNYDCNDALQYLVRKLNAPYQTGRENASKLWDILTALRGSDQLTITNGRTYGQIDYISVTASSAKSATTNIIRGAIGMPVASSLALVSRPEDDTQANAEVRKQLSKCGGHFVMHAQNAFKALGLKWDEPNGARLFPNEAEAWDENKRRAQVRSASCNFQTSSNDLWKINY